jgi:hypothetical protein
MMESEDGFIELQSSAEHGGQLIPTELLAPVENFVDIGENQLRQHRYNNPEDMLPHFKLHEHIAEGHYRRPAGNVRKSNINNC